MPGLHRPWLPGFTFFLHIQSASENDWSMRQLIHISGPQDGTHRSADEWQTTLDSITDLIMVFDHEFRIVRVNAAAVSFVGLPLEEILGRHYCGVAYGSGALFDKCPLARMLESREHEEAILHDAERDAWFLVSVDPILNDKEEITGVVHTVKNVTERKRAQETISASEEFNRAVLASLKDYIAILDKNGTIVAVNEAWEQFARQCGVPLPSGLGPGVNYLEACGRFCRVPGDIACQARDGMQSVLDGKAHTFSLEYSVDAPSEARWYRMSAMPFRNPGGGIVVCHTDITGQRDAEMEARSRREELAHVTRVVTVAELATSMAHEINQPLTAILCNAEAAQRLLSHAGPDLCEVGKILDDIVEDGRRAGEVIRRIWALVRKEIPRRDTVVLNDVIWETIALIRSASYLDGLTIMAQLDSELSAVQGDRVQLQQVVLNLLLNATAAMKSTPLAQRKLIIETAMQDDRTARVSIKDSGTGIDEHSMSRLFEPFYTTRADGLGMGLSISRTIIRAHNGTIGAVNNREGGATFTFTLPAARGGQA